MSQIELGTLIETNRSTGVVMFKMDNGKEIPWSLGDKLQRFSDAIGGLEVGTRVRMICKHPGAIAHITKETWYHPGES